MQIIKKPADQQFWVVRAQSGYHVPNFEFDNLVAIEHLDHLKLQEAYPFFPEPDALLKNMLEHKDESRKRSKAQIQNHFNQIIRFIYEIKIGDWVICPTSSSIRIGRVVGNPYISKKVLEVVVDADTGASVRMRSNLRRTVVWGPKISRKNLPYKVHQALRSHQAVFSLNEYWQLLYHTIYPCFFDEEKFHFSIKINQKEDIDNYSVSHLLGFLSEAEAAARLHSEVDVTSPESFDAQFARLRKERALQLRTKAQFMSPGDIHGSLPLEAIKLTGDMIWFFWFYSALFGSKLVGWDGIIDAETKKKIFSFFAQRWLNKGGEIAKEELQISQPKYKTLELEDHSKDEEQQRRHVTMVDLERVFNREAE